MTDDELLAAELALGVLPPLEAEQAEQRVVADVGFARTVEWWRERIGTMGASEVTPPAYLWREIETRLADNDDAPRIDLNSSVRRWRYATAAMAVATGGMAFALFTQSPPPAAPAPVPVPRIAAEPLVAGLSGTRGDSLAVSFDRNTRALIVTPAVLTPGPRDVELWVIPVGATAPVSLGVIDPRAPSRHSLDPARAALLVSGATVAISLEPTGGSPTAAPTGPVVATGKIVAI